MRKYLKILSNTFATTLEYRTNFLGRLVVEGFSVASFLVLWTSVYRTNESVAGYNLSEALLYYIVIPLVSFITMCTISDEIAPTIKSGFLSNLLIKPYNIWTASFFETLGNKISVLLVTSPLYLAAFIYIGYFTTTSISSAGIEFALLFGILAFVMHFFMDLLIAWTAFWVDDTWAFYHAKYITFAILGGASFPLEFLPHTLQTLFNILPFKFIYYVPTSYFLGKRDPRMYFTQDLLQLFAWSLLFAAIGYFIWKKGLKRYAAFGG